MRWIPQVALLVSAVSVVGCGTPGDLDLDPSQVSRAGVGAECFELIPETADFGTPEKLCRVERSLMLRNVCTSPVTVTDLRVDSPTGEFAFTQSPAIPSGGLTLASGEALYLGVAFTGREPGAASGEIRVTTDDAGSKVTRSWPLTSTTQDWQTRTESFASPVFPERADVLVVIDNGPELEPFLQSVKDGLVQYVRYGHAAGVDSRIGFALVGSTPSHTSGELLQTLAGEHFIDPHGANWEAEIEATVSEIELAPSSHASFDTAVQALGTPGFMRPDTAKSVLFISAARENSVGTVADALNRLYGITDSYRRPWQLSISALAAFVTSTVCSDEFEDGRFAWAVAHTNGAMETLCAPGWVKAFEELGKTSFGFRVSFMLSEYADVTRGELEVAIDGVMIPRVDNRGTTIWTYYPESSSLVFEPSYVPEPDQTLTVTYPLFCSP